MNQGFALRKTFARQWREISSQAQQGKLALYVLTAGHGQNRAEHAALEGDLALPRLPTRAAGGLQPAWMQILSFHFKYSSYCLFLPATDVSLLSFTPFFVFITQAF